MSEAPFLERLLYTRKEAAQLLSMSVGNVDLLIASGQIRARRMGRLVRIPRQELMRLTREDVLPGRERATRIA
jgi:excisionase family DNA binding protein